MDFSFSDEQQMLRDSVSAYLLKNYDFDRRRTIMDSDEGWSPEVWNQLAEIGLLALPVPEDRGGLGGSAADLVAIAEFFGRHLLVEPYLGSIILGAGALAIGDEDSAAATALAEVMEGGKFAALAYEEGSSTPDPGNIAMRATRDGDGFVLSGEKRMVLGGGDADHLVVAAKVDGSAGDEDWLALLLVDPSAAGITISPYQCIDGRRAANIRFDAVKVGPEAVVKENAENELRELIARASLYLCAESVGAMAALVSQSAEYAATRKQFGVAIGSFQVVAHRLADMKIALTQARATLLYSTALIDAGQAGIRDLSILKGQTGAKGRKIGEIAIQTHGGVGMTDELSVSHFHKRLLANDAMLGDAAYHLRNVGVLSAQEVTG